MNSPSTGESDKADASPPVGGSLPQKAEAQPAMMIVLNQPMDLPGWKLAGVVQTLSGHNFMVVTDAEGYPYAFGIPQIHGNAAEWRHHPVPYWLSRHLRSAWRLAIGQVLEGSVAWDGWAEILHRMGGRTKNDTDNG